MPWKLYIILLFAVSLGVTLAILFIPDLAESFETWLLGFLARNAAV